MDVDGAAAVLAEQLVVDETRDVVHWRGSGGEPRQTGLHDYHALYAVPGLYEVVYLVHLGMRSPQLIAEVLTSVCPPVRRAHLAGSRSVPATRRKPAVLSAAPTQPVPAPTSRTCSSGDMAAR